MTVKLWAIRGVYQWKKIGDSVVTQVKLVCFEQERSAVYIQVSCGTYQYVQKDELEGPTHIPCPVCGELQIVRETPHGQITLAEHLDRCHA